MENCLRDIYPDMAIPYWDSTMDNILGDNIAQQSIMWSPAFMGNGKGDVITGPFQYWPLIERPELSNSSLLHRDLTVPPSVVQTAPTLMSDAAVNAFSSSLSMRDHTWFVNPTFESSHGAVHNWVGGVFADLILSPSDPIFFLHHSFVDCIWEIMRQNQITQGINPELDYPTDPEALGLGQETINGDVLTDVTQSYHYGGAPMGPFYPLVNAHGMSNAYTRDFYQYAPRPTCDQVNPHCGSPYLFCEASIYKCAPKLQLGAYCLPFQTIDPINDGPCMNGYCCGGTCMQQCDPGSIIGVLVG